MSRRTKKEIEAGKQKPTTLKLQVGNIPQELTERNQWVLWSYKSKNGKYTKIPYSPGGSEASSTDPATWSNFSEVMRSGTQCRGQYSGIGFVFAEEDSYTGIDLDDCIDPESGELKPWGKAIVEELSSYTETSPSGTGVKIWVKGRKPSNERCKAKFQDGEVEMYDRGRYFAMTGQHWPGTPATIEERQPQIDALYAQVFPPKASKDSRRENNTPRPETRSFSDDELIEKASAAKNGDKFARLLAGDTSDYHGDDSSADQALCNRLAFWTNKDRQQMDRIFRSSGLMRAKWDEQRGEKAYGQKTIDKACDYVQETYQGSRRRSRGGNPSSNGNGHTNGNGECQAHRPEIILGTDEYRVNDEAIKALSNHTAAPEIYQRGNTLVRILRTKTAGNKDRDRRPEGSPQISELPGACVSEILTRVADIQKWHTNKKGEKTIVPAHPTERMIATVLARGDWPRIRPLEAVIEAPTLRPDGTVLDSPGWDAETGLLYEPNADYPPIPHTPSQKDAMRAAERLLDLVDQFPFAGKTRDEQFFHRAAWLAGLLTVLARFAINGCCPLFLLDANSPGTGKSMLADAIATVATGRGMSRTTFPANNEELDKRITAIALAGDRLMMFDNIEAGVPFGGASLDAALTGQTYQGRILGISKMSPVLPMNTIFFGTGNNVSLKGDIRRRIVPTRLETNQERPEERDGYKYPNLLEHIRDHRPQFVCDGLTIIRAYVAAGRPKQLLTTFGSYEAWSDLIRSAIVWVIDADPCATRERMRENDPAISTLSSLLEGWAELPGGQTGLTVAEALRILNNPEKKTAFTVLRGALMDWSRNDKLPGSGEIGHKLRGIRGRIVEKRAMHAESASGGTMRWRIVVMP